IHHVMGWARRKPWGDGISLVVPATLSTYDGDTLTRLVVASHDECVRLQVDPSGPRGLALRFHPRIRAGHLFQRHPTIEQAISAIRQEHDWLIWSNEHRAWWAPNQCGYRGRVEEAGRYSFAEACEICRQANRRANSTLPPDVPPETMVPAWARIR